MSKHNRKSKQDSVKNREFEKERDFEKEYNKLFPGSTCNHLQQWKSEGDMLKKFTLLEEKPTYNSSDTIIYR